MAAFKMMILGFAIVSCACAASLNINEQKENRRVRRQFANPGSTLQQTIQGIPNNRRPGQSGNFGSGQGSTGFGNQGQGFGNQGQGSNGFGNQGQGSNGFGNQGQGFGNQGQSSNGLNNNQGGSNGGGQFGWTTQRPPFNIISNENSIDAQTSACIRNCGVVNNYNPVCGNDNVTYQNPQKLQCAQQQCNRQVQAAYNGACVTTRSPNGR